MLPFASSIVSLVFLSISLSIKYTYHIEHRFLLQITEAGRQSKMGAAERQKGVVKLVHAGGFVEVHRKPIYAYQVMEQNPRHCVTRPDFFKYPWIVVRPDSLLKLGYVFYIVPNHTVYNLLQSHCWPQQNAPPKPCFRHGQEEKRPQIDAFERAGAKAAAAGGGNHAAPKPCLRLGDRREEKRLQIDGFESAGAKAAAAAGGNNAAPKPCSGHGDGQEEKMFQVIRKVRFRLPEGAAENKINCSEEKVKMWLLDQRS